MRKGASRQAGLAEDLEFCGRFVVENSGFKSSLAGFYLFIENRKDCKLHCLKLIVWMIKLRKIWSKVCAFVRKISKTQNSACGKIFTFLISGIGIGNRD